MSFDNTLRAICAIACVYTFGLFVTITSTAALNAVAHEPGGICSDTSCAVAAQHHALAGTTDEPGFAGIIHTAALFLAGE